VTVGPSADRTASRGRAALAPRQRDFRSLWTADSIRQPGSQLSGIALPVLVVATLHAGEAQMGVLTACGTLAFLLAGLPARAPGWTAGTSSPPCVERSVLGRGARVAAREVTADRGRRRCASVRGGPR
jgi:hypothetical protein